MLGWGFDIGKIVDKTIENTGKVIDKSMEVSGKIVEKSVDITKDVSKEIINNVEENTGTDMSIAEKTVDVSGEIIEKSVEVTSKIVETSASITLDVVDAVADATLENTDGDIGLTLGSDGFEMGVDFVNNFVDAAMDMDLGLSIDGENNFASAVDFGLGLSINTEPMWDTFEAMFGSTVFEDDVKKLTRDLDVMIEVDDSIFGQSWDIHWKQEVQADGTTAARWDIDYVNNGWDMQDIADQFDHFWTVNDPNDFPAASADLELEILNAILLYERGEAVRTRTAFGEDGVIVETEVSGSSLSSIDSVTLENLSTSRVAEVEEEEESTTTTPTVVEEDVFEGMQETPLESMSVSRFYKPSLV